MSCLRVTSGLVADGAPMSLAPDTGRLIRLVAAADEETARGLLGEFA